ncbi:MULTISPECIES: DNA circularization protein [Sphingomonas]|uniref:DNA circularization protein n=1 Tax=Sphingomonas TaxID=13687 RepID=UPI0008330DCF|nr:DNA circularization N-terminal domain-containing protein [Sphingomonas sp. CCH10-B3]
MALLAKGLLPASFRGAPFAVINDDVGGGRRVVVHQYPGRDTPWTEDMGREARRFRFRGFIVDGDVVFAGGPIQLQRLLLLAALEKGGEGTLTHPTLGILNVRVSRFSIGADLGAGRVSDLDIEFVESGKRQFPSALSQDSGLLSAKNLAIAALVVDGVRAIAVAAKLAAGGGRKALNSTGASWATRTLSLGRDATALSGLATQLPGNYGRFAGRGNVGRDGRARSIYSDATTVADLATAATIARAAMLEASMALGKAIATTALADTTDIASAAAALVASLVAACADPGDAVRLLVRLARFESERAEAKTQIGRALVAILQRAIAAELASAVADYQLSSTDDAIALINLIAPLLDDLATHAADAGEDDSFRALRAIRAALVTELRRRAGPLPSLRKFRPDAPRPSLMLAQRYYRDATRSAELEAETLAIHPLFMPTEFQGLAR